MIRTILIITILSGLTSLSSCDNASQSVYSKSKKLERFFWSNKDMTLENIQNYKLNIVLNNTTKGKSLETNTTKDTVLIFGQNSCFFSSTKQNSFYTDDKYFVFFYPDSTSMYGKTSKDQTMQYHNNIIRALIHCKEKMTDYTVDSTNSYNSITINLEEGNDLNMSKITIKASNSQEEFKIKNISYFIKSNTQASETSIDIIDYCFNTSQCNEKFNLSPLNFYTESGDKILLTGKYANYKLGRFWQL